MVRLEFFHMRFSFLVGKPAVLSSRNGSPLETCCDSASERSQSASDEDELWRWERLCQQTDSPSGPDSDARHRARRKLCMACAVSLLFMAGEMIGRHKKKKAVILQPFTERKKKTCLLASRLACRWIRRSQSGHHDRCGASSGWLWQHRHQPFLPVAGLPASHRRHDLRVASSRWGELICNGASLEGMMGSSEGSDVKADFRYIVMKQHSSCSAVAWCVPQRSWVCCCRWCPSGLWRQR